jgi:hypothetical protein
MTQTQLADLKESDIHVQWKEFAKNNLCSQIRRSLKQKGDTLQYFLATALSSILLCVDSFVLSLLSLCALCFMNVSFVYTFIKFAVCLFLTFRQNSGVTNETISRTYRKALKKSIYHNNINSRFVILYILP